MQPGSGQSAHRFERILFARIIETHCAGIETTCHREAPTEGSQRFPGIDAKHHQRHFGRPLDALDKSPARRGQVSRSSGA